MGISTAGMCIADDEVVAIASLEEIRRRKAWTQEVIDRGDGNPEWIAKLEDIEKKCLRYCEYNHYNTKLNLL